MTSLGNAIALINASMRHIQKSARDFDAGDLDEAFRLSTDIVSLLCDDGKDYQSLMGQIGQKTEFPFFSTASRLNSTNLVSEHPLVSLSSFDYPHFSAKLSNLAAPQIQPLLDFKKWWNQDIFMGQYDKDRMRIKRGNLIRDYRNARGSHKGHQIRANALKKIMFEGIGWYSDDKSPLLSVEKAMVRQIAWEVEQSILHPLASLFPFQKIRILDADSLLLSKRPYISPHFSLLSYSDGGFSANFNLKNWGGVDCSSGRVALAFGISLDDISWIFSN